jgi:hypothetical protein
MYKVNTAIQGVSPILQHKFGDATLDTLGENAKRRTAKADYSLEWMATMYVSSNGLLFQPAAHIEAAMVRAATNFIIKGRKTFKDAFKGFVYVTPDEIPHLWNGQPVTAPDESLLIEPTENLSVSIMRVVVNRAAVARSRLQVEIGWQLAFTIEVHDDSIAPETLRVVLEEAGRAFGIGDNRPRYGRFEIVQFAPQ